MVDDLLSDGLRWLGGVPCFLVFGKARREPAWRVIHVYASARRDRGSAWPFWRGTCTTWTSQVIGVGWDFARQICEEQKWQASSRDHATEVIGGRLRDAQRRSLVGGPPVPSASEVLAHECGHTWQALRLGGVYLPLVGSVTWLREGPRPWNRFENEASEQGLFGGLVPGSVCPALLHALANPPSAY